MPPVACRCGCDEMIEGQTIFYRTDTGAEMTLADAPVGAMWYADWMIDEKRVDGDNRFIGPDGHCLVVRLPFQHDWMVDGRCSNCTLPNDNTHKCWVRHGRTPDIWVDKEGVTCAAGAGSIGVWNRERTAFLWHGFLRNGQLIEC